MKIVFSVAIISAAAIAVVISEKRSLNMRDFCKNSKTGSISEATMGLVDPKVIFMMVGDENNFSKCVEDLEKQFPGVPSIGCIANGYTKAMHETGVTIIAFYERVEARVGILTNASTVPVKDIESLYKNIKSISPGGDNTVCIDFCVGNDACVLTSIHQMLKENKIPLMGGTGDKGKLSCNGKIYEDCCVYALVKNLSGKAIVYKENLYVPMEEFRFIASDTDKSKYYVGKLNGKSAKRVYAESLNITEDKIGTQTFTNPLGKMVGRDVCIISLKEISGEGLCCFRQVNDSDVLTLLKIQDYKMIAQNTIKKIKNDFKNISAIFSVNCAFRYIYFNEHDGMNNYLNLMNAVASHSGFVGYGEHCNDQFVNQSMSCVVFE